MSIVFEKVNHTYNKDTPLQFIALKDINLNIENGSFTALIGHTGSGKSTLIQHVNALLLPDTGSINVDSFIITNKKMKDIKELRKKAGMVFQFPEYQLFEETILKDIIFGPKNFGMDETEAIEEAKKALEMVGLTERYLEKSPFEMSGGQKRRVAIAGILIMKPSILILDEPTAGLDPKGTREMMELFKSLNEQGVTILMVTHDMNNVLNYCDHAIVMNKGRIEKHCEVTELFKETDYLSNLSIDLPTITHFILELNKQGFNINPSIKTIDELVNVMKGIE